MINEKGLTYNIKENDTKCHTFDNQKKEEQERTKIKKKFFLEIYRKLLGSIKATCEKVDIERRTFYRWMEEDEDFRKDIGEAYKEKLDDVEQALNKKIIEGDATMIRYFLDRKHPDYRPRSITEVIAGTRTLEDLFDEYKNKDEGTTEQQNTDRKAIEDPKQEGTASAVQVQHSTGVLLDEKDTPKSDIESTPKGDK